jgi:hypothetical protein
VILSGSNAVFVGPAFHAVDQATGDPRWSLSGPVPLGASNGQNRAVASDALVVSTMLGDRSADGFFVAKAGGQALWARWGGGYKNSDWALAVSGTSVFASDSERLYRFPGTS